MWVSQWKKKDRKEAVLVESLSFFMFQSENWGKTEVKVLVERLFF